MEFDDFKALLAADRTVRRWDRSRPVDRDTLEKLVELTRYCASGRNLQPLRYRPVTDAGECDRVFSLLKWAGYLPDWPGPVTAERPAAYLVQALDTDLTTHLLCDDGLQLQAITLGATAMGLGCCIVKAFDAAELSRVIGLPERFRPLYVVALGYPVEQVRIVDTDGTNGADIRYYREADGLHIVPKRPLEELILH